MRNSNINSINGINSTMTFTEASELWNVDSSTLRKLVKTGKLLEGIDYRKSGKIWLITTEAMIKIFGNQLATIYVGIPKKYEDGRLDFFNVDVLTEEEYKNLSENKGNYYSVEINLSKGNVFYLDDLDLKIEGQIKEQIHNDNYESCYSSGMDFKDILKNKCLQYPLSYEKDLLVKFELLEDAEDFEDGEITDEVEIVITGIEIFKH